MIALLASLLIATNAAPAELVASCRAMIQIGRAHV